MPKVMDEKDADLLSEEIEATLSDAEMEQAATMVAQHDPAVPVGDLSDGGKVGGATLTPTDQHEQVEAGRATVRQAWMWDGTPSTISLAWRPNGKQHDSGAHYLRKRHCNCCGSSGFQPDAGKRARCPACEKKSCIECQGGLARVNSKGQPNLIPNFYLKPEAVPFAINRYGPIECFHPKCMRKGRFGYPTEMDMRLHARTRHTLEYLSYQEGRAEATGSHAAVEQLAEMKALIEAQNERLAQLEAPVAAEPLPVETVPETVPTTSVPTVVADHRHRFGRRLGSECKEAGCTVARTTAYKAREAVSA